MRSLMDRDELEELHYIVEINNMPSILRLGILSHNNIKNTPHITIANQEVQELRAKKAVPPGDRKLHDYANLYICARNPMLYALLSDREKLCVLKINTDVLDLPNVVITDGNAARNIASFKKSPEGLSIIKKDTVFANNWNDPDRIKKDWMVFSKCAEVLVPDCVEPKFIQGAYVSNDQSKDRLIKIVPNLTVTVNRDLFFL